MVLAGGFYTWYFQTIFQRFIGIDHISWLEQALTLVPGVGLTAGIIVAGHSLGRTHWHAGNSAKHRTRPRWSIFLSGLGAWITRATLPVMLIASIRL